MLSCVYLCYRANAIARVSGHRLELAKFEYIFRVASYLFLSSKAFDDG